MRTKFAVMLGAALVAVLVFSGVALASGPFAVTKMAPKGGATGIAPTANVKAFFNHNIKATTVTSSTFNIREQGTTSWLSATRKVNNTITATSTNGFSESVATLNPSADLASGTTYEVVVVGGSSGVKDAKGNALSANKSWTFTTAGTPPSTNPTVVSHRPTTGETSNVNTRVLVTFSEAMDPNTVTSTTFTLAGATSGVLVPAQVTYDSASKTAILDPDNALSDSTWYKATVISGSNGVKDTEGNSLAQDYTWNFMPCSGYGNVYSAQSIEPQITVCS